MRPWELLGDPHAPDGTLLTLTRQDGEYVILANAILLDVDNGPTGLTRSSNDWLYGAPGLDAAFDALRPGGVLGIWSAAPDRAFTRRLARAGFDAEPVEVRARGTKGGRRHLIWIGVRRPEPPDWRRPPA